MSPVLPASARDAEPTPAAVIHPFRDMSHVRPATGYREHVGRTRPNWLVVYPQSEYSCPMKSNIGNTVIETESFIKQAAAHGLRPSSTI